MALLAAECGKLDYNIGLREGVASDRIRSNDAVWSQIPFFKAQINRRFQVKGEAEPIVCVNAYWFEARRTRWMSLCFYLYANRLPIL